MPQPINNPSLHRFAVLTAIAALALIGLGGLVTSHGVGMAVPDWPNTYGYNMFFFPISQWVGGIFYEHTHRLLASGVGLLTTLLALWLYGRSARPFMRWSGLALLLLGAGLGLAVPRHWTDGFVLGFTGLALFAGSLVWPRCQPSAPWLRWLGLAAFFAVVLQGVLGGLRVVLYQDQIGIFHATLAQLFFVLLCALSLFTSRWWQQGGNPKSEIRNPKEDRRPKAEVRSSEAEGRGEAVGGDSEFRAGTSVRRLAPVLFGTTLLILAQLILGATMRHQHAGLAIPDFPLAYHKLWPAMDPASVAHYNQQRLEVVAAKPITAFQIGLQMAHRLLAVGIFGAVAFCAWSAWRKLGPKRVLSRLALCWLALILIQVLLGAATIWSNKAADLATAHVLAGALSLAVGAMLSIISFRGLVFVSRPVAAPMAGANLPQSPFGPPSSTAPSLEI